MEWVLESYPVHSVLSYPMHIPKGYVLPANAVEVCSSLGSSPLQCKAVWIWAMGGMGAGLRTAEDAPLLHH